MRVTGGSARGVLLRPPRSTAVRPTTDKVRTALFNILAPLGLEGALVADFYAGTGSLGIEALSRGAEHADFIEADRRQVSDIAANLEAAKVSDRASVLHGTVEQAIERLQRGHTSYDFILADPPYTRPFPVHTLELVDTLDLLAADGVLVIGHASRVVVPDICGRLHRWQDRRYGDSTLAFYRHGARDQLQVAS